MHQLRETIAKKYLSCLEKASVEETLLLFAEDAVIESPLYGQMPARLFYTQLFADTMSSTLRLDGIFSEPTSSRILILFEYQWKLRNHQQVIFNVVDVLEFDSDNKITTLKIIYDTARSKEAFSQLE